MMSLARSTIVQIAGGTDMSLIEDAIEFGGDEYWAIVLYSLSEYGNTYRLYLCKDYNAHRGRWYELPSGLLPIHWIEQQIETAEDGNFTPQPGGWRDFERREP